MLKIIKNWFRIVTGVNGDEVGPQNPLCVDGDSVYEKDIDTTNSSIGDFSGSIADLFNNRTSTITTETDNPSLTIALKRPIHNYAVTLITSSGDFSNVTIVAKNAAGTTLETIDDSANSTKYTSKTYWFTSIDKWCALDISFTTTDTVTLSFLDIHKSTHTMSHLHALKPDGTCTAIDATAGGNLKVSLEELENNISVNSNKQLRVTLYDSSGSEKSGAQTTRIYTNIGGVEWDNTSSGIDKITNSLNVVDYAHHEIHSGSMFRVQHNQDNIPAVGSSGELVIAFFVPSQSKEPHMLWDFFHEGDMTMKLLEGVTFNSSAGTDVAPKNSNRNSANTSVLQGKATGSLVSDYVTVGENSVDSIYSGGTVISLKRSYSARNTPSSGTRKNEVVLKTNTNYAFVLANNETTTQGGQIRLEWYEHTPAN